jgi:hypothetical protein
LANKAIALYTSDGNNRTLNDDDVANLPIALNTDDRHRSRGAWPRQQSGAA